MLRKFGSHLRDQWMGALALFLVLTGGTAYAANTVFSTDIANNEVYGIDIRDDTLEGGGLGHVDLKPGAVRSSEVANNSLTGADIRDHALTGDELAPGTLPNGTACPSGTTRLASTALCYETDLSAQTSAFSATLGCGAQNRSLPSPSEANAIARVTGGDQIWSDVAYYNGTTHVGVAVNANSMNSAETQAPYRCVAYATDQ